MLVATPSAPVGGAVLATSGDASRAVHLDALRATMTILVIFHHAAITYGASGGWFYREVPAASTPGAKLLVLFCTINQAYFMGLFFLLAGAFTPPSLARHGAWGFLKEKALRLGLPLVVFGFIVGPFTIALARTANGRPLMASLWQLWSRGTFENGPPWFVQALLIFSLVYAAMSCLGLRVAAGREFPSNYQIALAAVATGALAFALRLVWPVGTQVFGLQLGYFASYVVLFAAGCLGSSSAWLTNVPDGQRRLWFVVSLAATPLLPAAVLLASAVPMLRGDTAGGWNIQAALYAFWEPFVAWGLIMALLCAYRHRLSRPGPIWRALSRRAYAIFLIHPPVLVAIALAGRAVAAPPLVKFATAGTLASLACYAIAGLLLRIPKVRQIV